MFSLQLCLRTGTLQSGVRDGDTGRLAAGPRSAGWTWLVSVYFVAARGGGLGAEVGEGPQGAGCCPPPHPGRSPSPAPRPRTVPSRCLLGGQVGRLGRDAAGSQDRIGLLGDLLRGRWPPSPHLAPPSLHVSEGEPRTRLLVRPLSQAFSCTPGSRSSPAGTPH